MFHFSLTAMKNVMLFLNCDGLNEGVVVLQPSKREPVLV